MHLFGAGPDVPLAEIPECELYEAHSRCEQALRTIQAYRYRLADLLKCAASDYVPEYGSIDEDRNRDPVYDGDLEAIASAWMECLAVLRSLYPPYAPEVELLITRANVAYDSRRQITLGGTTNDYPTTHAAVHSVLGGFINLVDASDITYLKRMLTCNKAPIRHRERLAKGLALYQALDITPLIHALWREWALACEWLAERSGQRVAVNKDIPKDVISGDETSGRVTQTDLHNARVRCELLASECHAALIRLKGILNAPFKPFEPLDVYYDPGSEELKNYVRDWMAQISAISRLCPPFSRDVRMVIERANEFQEARTTIQLDTMRKFTTTHHAVAQLGEWFLEKLPCDDAAVLAATLSSPLWSGMVRISLHPVQIDLDKLVLGLSVEWRRAADWLDAHPIESSTTSATIANDLISRDDVALLVGVEKSTLQKRISKWGGAKQFPDPCSYAIIRPKLLQEWGKKSHLFSESYQEVQDILAVRRRDRQPAEGV